MGKEFFGTDGIRGVPGTPPLDDATLYATGRSLGAYLRREHGAAHVLIGLDTRESGPHMASLLAAGLREAGARVAFAGVITTPGVACLVRQNDFQAGVVISASHNPFQDNGVKLFSHAGMKFPDAVEEELEAGILKHRGEPLGAEVIAMGDLPDGRNINAGCGSMHLDGLEKRVVAEKARLGVGFDGDADRALFVCESGKIVNGDGVLLAAARFLKSQNKLKGDRVVATSMSNLGLERALASENISLARAAVGDRYVLEEMLQSGTVLGGEQSGHIIFLEDSPAGDGLLTAAKIASLVSLNGKMESLVEGLKDYPQLIVNVQVRSKPPLESLPEVSRALAEAQSALGDKGRVVLRYSGTEQLARVMVEAEHEADVQRFSQSLAKALHSSIGA
ncbi:MAG: phosphoglucosamine mutase [Acidobacteria bacterium]|nr:MAG: phosphoglucosamine mutase [Acidobacteriota bacterium]